MTVKLKKLIVKDISVCEKQSKLSRISTVNADRQIE